MDTSQVTNMSQMFMNCRSLKELNLSGFKTSQVRDMSHMFGGCSDLRMLNITNFDTSNVTNMNGMFAGCETLEELDLSNFDTTNVSSMKNMFESTDALKSLKFGEKFVVPEHQEKDLKLAENTWIDIGTGTVENPKPAHKTGISSNELLAQADKGNWVVKPEKEYHGPFTVQITNNIADDLSVNVPEAIRPEYVGSTFEINVPQKVGYSSDKKVIKVMALENRLSSTDSVTYTKDEQPVEKVVEPIQAKPTPVIAKSEQPATPVEKVVEPVQPKPAPIATKVEKTAPDTFEVKGTVTKFMHYVTVHPDLPIAKVYDATGKVVKDKALIKNYSWLSDKVLTIEGKKYYHVIGNEWVDADDVYLYKEAKNLVKTKDVVITPLVNSRGKAIVNRGLGSLDTIESDKVVMVNDHKYYQVTTDEFVDSDNVDLVNA